jgi:hypothetical protein
MEKTNHNMMNPMTLGLVNDTESDSIPTKYKQLPHSIRETHDSAQADLLSVY